MKTLKTLVVAKSIAAAGFIAAGVASPATSFASPNDGMVCRPGYNAQFNGTNLKCVKIVAKVAGLECHKPGFAGTPVIRAPGAPGDTSGGKDLCTRPGVVVGSTDALTGLVLGQDYVFAEVNPTKVAAIRVAAERNEETALGLTNADVDSAATNATVVVNGGFGSTDEARFNVTLFTFPVPALGLNLSQIQPPIFPPRLP